jgi:glycosyltransferase involved in cell wall biosynthesis
VRLVERALALGTHRIIAISPLQRDDLVEHFRVASPNQVAVVPLGLELAPFFETAPNADARASFGLGPEDFAIGYVGRFVPIKSLPTLLQAFRIVRATVPRAKLVLVGDGELRGELEHLAEGLGIAADVRFAGWRRDLTSVYSAFDAAALSSRNEGTPVMLLEAMAAALPVVATRVGGVADVVENGTTGLLVQAGNAEALAKALIRVAQDAPLRARLAARACESVRTRFESARLVADIDRVYREALGELRTAVTPAARRPSC